MEYVVGLLFDNIDRVLLINKNRPDWQRGYFNGLGGAINEGETSKQAMSRECKEESGLDINTWEIQQRESFKNGVQLYYMKATVDCHILDKAESLTDEEVSIFDIDSLPKRIQPDIREMIEFCTRENKAQKDVDKFVKNI